MRAVLDTNVVMSAFFFGGTPLKIVRSAFSRKIELVASKAVLSEYREVAEWQAGRSSLCLLDCRQWCGKWCWLVS